MAKNERLSRRQLLTALLGWQFANTVGCGTSRLPPAGELTHTRFEVGHLLRDGMKKTVSSDAYEDVAVTIVGGGVAGLAAAWRFQRAGFSDFVLAELETNPGGTARGGSRNGFKFPWGAHYIPVPMPENKALIQLLSEMEVIEALTEVKGIGEWTAQMYLIFVLGRSDVLPCADLGVQNAMRDLYELSDRPSPQEMEAIARPWRPYASIGSWYCWRFLD